VRPDELLSSFVFRPEHIDKRSNTIRHHRLMPRRRNKEKAGRLETSVCRSENLTADQTWMICAEYFDNFAPKPAIGRGVGLAEAVFSVGLRFDADGVPYPQHANIIGWHDDASRPDDELKHYWMDQAQKMAVGFRYEPRG
jgi:hypothetical protein